MQEIIKHFGGQSALAKKLNVDKAAVSQWVSYGFFPPKRAIQIERITNGLFKAVDMIEHEG